MRRPFIFINSAMSADGKISSIDRGQLRISGREDLARVDRLRAESDAVMVGVGTVLADDPGLKVKSSHLLHERTRRGLREQPLRVVADSSARTPPQARILGEGCLVAVSARAPAERLARLRERCEILRCGQERVDLGELTGALYKRGVNRLMVEGGGTLNWSLLQAGLVDEIFVYIGAMILGGKDAPTLVDGSGYQQDYPRLKLISIQSMDDGVLLRWHVAGVP